MANLQSSVISEANSVYPINEKESYITKIKFGDGEKLVLVSKGENNEYSFQEVQLESQLENQIIESDVGNLSTVENVSKNLPSSSETLNNNALEELLIEEVRKRPPIYDYTLPLFVRGRQQMADLWKEISEALNGALSPDNAKKKWKSLKDTFSKAVADEKKPSGSARCSKKSWKHLEQMSFLRSISSYRTSISNITVPNKECNNNLSEENSLDDNIEQHINNEDRPPAKRRAKSSDDLTDSICRIAEAICTQDKPVINLPKPSEINGLDGIFIYIKDSLQKLNAKKQNMLILKFLQDIAYEQEDE